MSSTTAANEEDSHLVNGDIDKWIKYEEYPLVKSMLEHQSVRDGSFICDAITQFEYPKGDEGWIRTIFLLRGRALHQIALPWTVVSLHAVIVTLLIKLGVWDVTNVQDAVGDFPVLYGYVLNVALSFVLVFRLNRAAERYWIGREFWGKTIALGRSLTSGMLTHGGHNPELRDDAVRWLCAATVSVMAFMRGDKVIPENTLCGVLDKDSIRILESANHMPVYACDRVRDTLKQLFMVTAETPLALSNAWTVQLDRLERELNDFMMQFGAMERVRATPLPIVYVAHLRTFLLIYLILFPYVFAPTQGWATIPLTVITSFAFLGIEGASSEVENPFKKGHINNLNMDAMAMVMLQNIQQQIQTKADIELERRAKHV